MNFKKSSVKIGHRDTAEIEKTESIKISKGVKTPPSPRKSLRSAENALKRGVTPSPRFTYTNVFISLHTLFIAIKKHLSSSFAKSSYTFKMHNVFMCIACFKDGISCYNLCMFIFSTRNTSVIRAMFTTLDTLIKYKLVSRYNNKYFISIDAENLIHKIVSKKDLKEMHNSIKEFMK